MVDKTKETTGRINKIIEREASRLTDTAYDNIFSHGPGNAQLPEATFKSVFLPFFSGQVKDDKNFSIQTNWVGVAGSPMSSVDVIDEAGQVLYTVPPLMSTDFLHGKDNLHGKNFHRLFDHAQKQATRIPGSSDKIIGELGGRLISEIPAEPASSDAAAWKEILTRYGISQPDPKTGKATKPSNPMDELEFD